MAFETFDLGNVLQTAEAIKGARRQTNIDRLREQYLGQQVQDAQTNAASQQSAMNAKRVLAGSQAVLNSQDPKGTAEALFPEFVKDFDTQHGPGAWQNLPAEQLVPLATHMRDQASMQLGEAPPMQMQIKGDLNHPENGVYKVNPLNNDIQQVTPPQKSDTLGQSRLDEEKRHNRAIEGKGGSSDSPYDPQTLRTAAVVVASDPTRMRDYATYGATGQAARVAIQKEVTNLKNETGMTDGDFVLARSRAKAATANLGTLTKQQAQVAQAEELAKANGDRLLQLFDLVDQTGIPAIEGITRSARAKAGNVDAAELRSVMTAFQTEAARILSGNPNMTGVVSDSLRQEIQHMAPESMSTAQAKRVVNRLYTEFAIRQNAIQEQLDKAANSTVVGAQPTAQPAPQQPPAQPQQPAAQPQVYKHPSGAIITILPSQ
jgi:hypothetical protein